MQTRRKPLTLRGLITQVAMFALCLAAVAALSLTTASNLQVRGIPFGFNFLFDRAGFTVAETLLPYEPANSNLWAIIVGVGNTLFVSILVAIASTVLGTGLGIGRLSQNPLVTGFAQVWIEGVRNTPPILLLIFLYTMWWTLFPAGEVVQLAPGVLGSIRGVAMPSLDGPWFAAPAALLGGSCLVVLIARGLAGGRVGLRDRATFILALVVATASGALAMAAPKTSVSWPSRSGADINGGLSLTPELFTIVFGLTLYTTGFVAEIVRGGLEAVPRGQWEAARALGLRSSDTLRRVIIPQMMRMIVPPMTSQYINVVKNSTLALAIGYTDFMTIMGTMINKTNHAVEGTALIIGVYLFINLGASVLLDRYNRRAAIPER